MPKGIPLEECITEKVCVGCGETKSLDLFYSKSEIGVRGQILYKSNCKACEAKNRKQWQRENKEQFSTNMRDNWLKTGYGITDDEYFDLLITQEGKCAICGTKDPGRGNSYFCIDHNHKTGAIRGLLCLTCNAGIGMLGDSPDRVMNAAAYLLSHTNVLEIV